MKPQTTSERKGIGRRKTLAAVGSTIGLAVAGCLGGQTGTVSAANIEIEGLEIPNSESEIDGEPSEVTLTVDGSYELSTTLEEPEQARFTLQARPQEGSTEELSTDVIFEPDSEGTGSFSFDVNLLDHSELTASQFEASAGESVSQTVKISVVMQLVESANVIEEISEYTDVVITVQQTGESHTLEFGAVGEIQIT